MSREKATTSNAANPAEIEKGLIDRSLSLSSQDETISFYPNALKKGSTLVVRHKNGQVINVQKVKNSSKE